MKKSLIILFVIVVVLSGCSKPLKRTDVVDHLIEKGFARNDIGFYEKSEELYILRVGYNVRNSGFLNSVSGYYTDGPVMLQDYGLDVFAYLYNDDILGFSKMCGYKNDELLITEVLFFPETAQIVVGNDFCEIFEDDESKDEMKSSFVSKYEELVSITDSNDLTAEMIEKLVE